MRIYFIALYIINVLILHTGIADEQACGQQKNIQYSAQTISLLQGVGTTLDQLKRIIPDVLKNGSFEFSADIDIDSDDLAEMCGTKTCTDITPSDLLYICTKLATLKRFKSVTIERKDAKIYIQLEAADLIERVQLSGTIIGRDRYRAYYHLHAGDQFEHEAHARGIQSIRTALIDEGYYDACVVDTIIRNDTYHTIKVLIEVQQGKRFTIEDIKVVLHMSEQSSSQMSRLKLERRIHAQLYKKLRRAIATRATVNHESEQIRQLLIDEGYLASTIRLVETISHERKRISLTFSIELPSKHGFVFHGNYFFSRKRLLQQIMLFGNSTSLIPAPFLGDELSALYQRHGFLDVKITWREDTDRIFFFIDEGKQSHISTVDFEGVTAFDHQFLIARAFQSLIKSRVLTEELLKASCNLMMQLYLEQGYWDIELIEYAYKPLVQKGAQNLIVRVSEGKQRFLKKVELDVGFSMSIPQEIHMYTHLDKPIPFDMHIVRLQKDALIRVLREEGRIAAIPYPELIEDPDGIILRWHMRGSINEVRFGHTLIRDNGRVPAYLIRRELLYREGEIWNNTQLNETISQLRRLGIFEQVSLVPDETNPSQIQKDLILQCIPDAPFELRVRAGAQGVNRNIFRWNGGASYKCGISFLAKNPFQKADLFKFDANVSRYMHDIYASYRLPRLFQKRVRTEVRLFSSRYDQPVYVGSPQILYRLKHMGILTGLEKWDGRTKMGCNIGMMLVKLQATPCSHNHMNTTCQREENIIRALTLNPQFFKSYIAYAYVEPTLFFDRLDTPVDPFWGSLTLFSLKALLPYNLKAGACIKLLLEQSFFFPIARAVFAFRVRAGTIFPVSFAQVPPSERFYLGGSHSIRSYEADYAPPLNNFRTCSHTCCLVPTGGLSMCNINSELRIPLYGRFKGVIFVDIGALSDSTMRALVRERHLVGGVGIGFRYNTIIGPLRFDIGWKVPKDRMIDGEYVNERSFAWFLTLGHAF